MKTDKTAMNELKQKLAQACRILYMEGLSDFNLGHVSNRVPDRDAIFIKPSGLGLEEIAPDDVILVDLEGNIVEGRHPAHGETPIHTEIYKMRKDVKSVVHIHPVFTTAFSASRSALKPLNQDGVLFSSTLPVFGSPELITTRKQGHELAEKLGDSSAILLRNHGIITVGTRIEEACMNALFFERAVRVQVIASLIGEEETIPQETALKMFAEFSQNLRRYDMIWDYLVRKLEREGLGLS